MKNRRTAGIGVLCLVIAAGCTTDSDAPGESAAESQVASAPTFPDLPADGPLPEIGPAPADYQPTAGGAPSTDIWIGDLVRSESGLTVADLTNATDRDGYDNQPHFGADGSLYFVAAIDQTQTDVMSVGPTGDVVPVTRSEASEFSPTPIPGQDAFSAIHELRGKQYLWRYGPDGSSMGPIFSTAEPVGYHAWANETVVVMFILGDPATLQVGDAATGEIRVIAENPGRSIHRIPGTNQISFVRKVSDEEWWIERLDPVSGQSDRVTQTLEGHEDYAWTPVGEILMGSGSALHTWTPDGGWSELQDFAAEGVQGITRLAVSPDGARIAIVSTRD